MHEGSWHGRYTGDRLGDLYKTKGLDCQYGNYILGCCSD